MKSKRSAFTLIEIMIVVGIIIMLMGITTQMLGSSTDAQGKARAKADMELIADALEQFRSVYGDYPRISCAGEEKYSAARLYQCLVGKMYMVAKNGQISFLSMSDDSPRRPFIDASKMNLGSIQGNDDGIVDPEKSGVFFADPWGEPYIYIYDTSSVVGAESAWLSPNYILLCKGPDNKAFPFGSMYMDGVLRDVEAYRNQNGNEDNLIRGID